MNIEIRFLDGKQSFTAAPEASLLLAGGGAFQRRPASQLRVGEWLAVSGSRPVQSLVGLNCLGLVMVEGISIDKSGDAPDVPEVKEDGVRRNLRSRLMAGGEVAPEAPAPGEPQIGGVDVADIG